MNFASQTEAMVRELDEAYEAIVATAKSLQQDFLNEEKDFVCYRTFTIRNESTSMRIEWGRVVYKGNKRMKNPQRINLGKGYTQSVKFMGTCTQNHQLLFNKYEPQLAVLRELSDKNRTARKALLKLQVAAQTHKM